MESHWDYQKGCERLHSTCEEHAHASFPPEAEHRGQIEDCSTGCQGTCNCLTAHSLGQGSNCILASSLSSCPGSQGSTGLLFFSSYWMFVSFLQPWLCRSPSASFQLVFSENCSTCRCTFDVFVEGGEFHILLLHHLDKSPQWFIYLYFYYHACPWRFGCALFLS